MYMRVVRLNIDADRVWELQEFYRDRLLPVLKDTEGCLFASLLQPLGRDQDWISLTLWDAQDRADRYANSGEYARLVEEVESYLAGSTEWRARLAGDRGAQPRASTGPVVEAYASNSPGGAEELRELAPAGLYLRIVALRVAEGRFDDLRRRYEEVVVPALYSTTGCRAAFLVEGVQLHARALSVTIWDNEDAAIRYELSGEFDRLTRVLREFFSGLYQWKLSLGAARDGEGMTGSDLDVSGYRVVTGAVL